MRPLPVILGGGVASGAAVAAGLFLLSAPLLISAANPTRADATPSAVAFAEIPPELRERYIAAGQSCTGLPWQVVAAIGAVESGHGTFGGATADPTTGDVAPPIVGPAIDGRPGFAAIRDPAQSDGWAHARGAMQFLTTTWRRWATLGQGRPDGAQPDIDNAWDAIASAGRFLCNDDDTVTNVAAAIRRYNNSAEYVNQVLDKATEYGMGNDEPSDDTDPAGDGPHGDGAGFGDTIPGDVAKVLAFARAQIGKPYVWGGEGPAGFDCSGLVLAAYRTVGIRLPHYATAQARYGRAVDADNDSIEPGDLIFTRGGSPIHDLGHVGIAIDDEQYIVAPKRGDVVKISPIPHPRLQAIRRLVNDDETSSDPNGPEPDPYGDADTDGSVDGAGLRWNTTLINRRLTRPEAVALARASDRVAATPTALAAHLTAMKAANKRLRVLGWIDITTIDITQPGNRSAIVAQCARTVDASGYDGCLLNIGLTPIVPCSNGSAPPTTVDPIPIPIAGTTDPAPTTTLPHTIAATCPTTQQWQDALRNLVTEITAQPETDGQLLVLINTDGTQPIVRPAA